jgi:hypothetical protein
MIIMSLLHCNNENFCFPGMPAEAVNEMMTDDATRMAITVLPDGSQRHQVNSFKV